MRPRSDPPVTSATSKAPTARRPMLQCGGVDVRPQETGHELTKSTYEEQRPRALKPLER
jgi:hypothetical protein